MSGERPVTEEELHALVDQALSQARTLEIEAYLAQHPDVAARIAAYAAQREGLRAALAPYAEEPLPAGLSLERLIERRPPPVRAAWRQLAASVALLVAGGAAGWMLRNAALPAQGGINALAREAVQSYAVFAPDRVHPVEMAADARQALVQWVSLRLGRPVVVPDLAARGWRLMGGRVVPTGFGPAGLFLYDDGHGTRITLLVRDMARDRDTPTAAHKADGLSNLTWSARGLGYGVVGMLPVPVLHPLADEMRRQTDQAA